jgi:hypothetical protein
LNKKLDSGGGDMCPVKYYTIMRQSKDPRLLRYEMVRYARDKGIKPAVRAFNTTPKTVCKWLKRWQPGSLRGWGALRIKRGFNLSISEKAIRKIWKEKKLVEKRRRKHKTKNDLRQIKARWRLFQQTDIDTKHLYDIPEYWIQMKRHHLPLFQYTAREVVSGMMFVSYATECTLTYATLFAEIIINHLKKCGVELTNSRFQTDKGSEFIGAWSAKEPSVFTKTVESVEGLIHDTIPPGAYTYQADVETVHGIIEDEFYEIEAFPSPQIFLAKATQYVTWFNIARRNSYKGNKTPWEIVHERDPTISVQK